MAVPEDDAGSVDAQDAFVGALDEMKKSMASTRELVFKLRENKDELESRDGISLLGLKPHLMLSYLASLSLLASHRALAHSFSQRAPPAEPFSSSERGLRGKGEDGPGPGDLVDSMIEGRVVLEKIKLLEGRMKYQIDKLVRIAREAPTTTSADVMDDPLAFRPNPENLVGAGMDSDGERDQEPEHGGDVSDASDELRRTKDGIYRPPKLAPMPYTEPGSKSSKSRARRNAPNALSHLARLDPSQPAVESTTGLGNVPASSLAAENARARQVRRMTEFEEENMTRLVLNKKAARQRTQDEADLALGLTPGSISGSGGGRRRGGGGLEDEFGDVLKAVSGRRKVRGKGEAGAGGGGDGYEELRERGRRKGVLERSRASGGHDMSMDVDGLGKRKRSVGRFEKDVRASKKRMSGRGRK